MIKKIRYYHFALLTLIFMDLIGSEVSAKTISTPWFDSAQIRIDSIRKGNFMFKVVDKNGNPVQDSVKIKHVKHEFEFGGTYDFTVNGNYGNTYTYNDTAKFKGLKDTLVYNTERYSQSLVYNLPVKIGNKYKLKLMFAELYWTAVNKRQFDVYINNHKEISSLDIFAKTKAVLKALDSTFTMVAKDSIIKIQLVAITDNAKIDGIALYDSINKPLLLLNCGGPATYTQEGKFQTDSAYIDKTSAKVVPNTDDWATSVLLKYFTCSVTGNPFKWSGIEADSGILHYDLVDAAVNWGTKVGYDYRGHNLIWGATSATDYHELPQWVHNLLPTPQRAWAACKNRVIRDGGKYGPFSKIMMY